MGFNKISVASKIRINSFRVSLYIALFGNHVIELAPTDKLVSITNGSKCHCHNIDNLNTIIKEIYTIISLHVVVQNTVIKLGIVGAHDNLSIVFISSRMENIRNRIKRHNIKSTIHVKLCLILHEAIATNENVSKRCINNLTHKIVVSLKRAALAILKNPRNVKCETGIGQSLNIKNSENLTHGSPPRLVIWCPLRTTVILR